MIIIINIYYRTDTGKYYKLDTVATSPKDKWHTRVIFPGYLCDNKFIKSCLFLPIIT